MNDHLFPQTRWTLVLSAKNRECDASSKALEELALAYWKPVYTYLRGRGYPHNEAQDETQAFFAHLLRRDFLKNIQPDGGRFRNFLLVCLRNRQSDEYHRPANRQQRAEVTMEHWHEVESMHGNGFPYPVGATPEVAFDRSWAEELVARAMRLLQQRWEKRAALFAELRFTVEGQGRGEKYADIAIRTGMTEGAVSKAAHELRRQFSEHIRKEVRETVADDDDVEEELRYLVQLLRT